MDDANEVTPLPRRDWLEHRLQASICEYLRWSLPAGALHYAIPNGGFRHGHEAARLVAEGVRAGMPDLCVLWDGRPIYLEVKAAGGRLSSVQLAIHQRLLEAGCAVWVVRSVREVEDVLRALGVPLRAKVQA